MPSGSWMADARKRSLTYLRSASTEADLSVGRATAGRMDHSMKFGAQALKAACSTADILLDNGARRPVTRCEPRISSADLAQENHNARSHAEVHEGEGPGLHPDR